MMEREDGDMQQRPTGWIQNINFTLPVSHMTAGRHSDEYSGERVNQLQRKYFPQDQKEKTARQPERTSNE